MIEVYKKYDPKQVPLGKSLVELLTSQEEFYIENAENTVVGLKYFKLDDCPFTNFLADSDLNAVANILPEDKKIIILEFHDSEGRSHHSYFYDSDKAKSRGIYQFNGTLYTALREFREAGFAIHKARRLTIDDPETFQNIPRNKRFIVTAENIDLEQFREHKK